VKGGGERGEGAWTWTWARRCSVLDGAPYCWRVGCGRRLDHTRGEVVCPLA
jgi:hypothetical protein